MTARPLISLASLAPGTPTLARSGVRTVGTSAAANQDQHPTPSTAAAPINVRRIRGLRDQVLGLITGRPGIDKDELHQLTGAPLHKIGQAIWQLKTTGDIRTTGPRGNARHYPGKQPPRQSSPAPEPLRPLAPLPFSKPSTPTVLDTPTRSALELIRTAAGDVLVIDGDTITHRIPAAVAEAIRHDPDL